MKVLNLSNKKIFDIFLIFSLGLFFIFSFFRGDKALIFNSLCGFFLLKLAQYDLYNLSFDDKFFIPLIILSIIYFIFSFLKSRLDYWASILSILFLFFYYIFSKLEKVPIGEGDLGVFALTFIYFKGMELFIYFFLTFLLAALYILLEKMLGSVKSKIPLIPFIYLSFIIVSLWGEKLVGVIL